MSVFTYRKPGGEIPARSTLETLKRTMKNLEAANAETPQIADLKRILAGRIAELEGKGT